MNQIGNSVINIYSNPGSQILNSNYSTHLLDAPSLIDLQFDPVSCQGRIFTIYSVNRTGYNRLTLLSGDFENIIFGPWAGSGLSFIIVNSDIFIISSNNCLEKLRKLKLA